MFYFHVYNDRLNQSELRDGRLMSTNIHAVHVSLKHSTETNVLEPSKTLKLKCLYIKSDCQRTEYC